MLPYTADVLYAFLARYNDAIWPSPIVACVLGLAVMGMAARPFAGSDRLVSSILAAAWAWTGGVYFLAYFATFDFAAPIYGGAFIAQAVLVLWAGVVGGRLRFRWSRDAAGTIAVLLAAIGLAAGPLFAIAAGRSWTAAPFFGTAPGPTAAFTFALLLIARPVRFSLAVVPLLWCLAGGATAWFLGIAPDLLFALAGCVAVASMVWKRRLSLAKHD